MKLRPRGSYSGRRTPAYEGTIYCASAEKEISQVMPVTRSQSKRLETPGHILVDVDFHVDVGRSKFVDTTSLKLNLLGRGFKKCARCTFHLHLLCLQVLNWNPITKSNIYDGRRIYSFIIQQLDADEGHSSQSFVASWEQMFHIRKNHGSVFYLPGSSNKHPRHYYSGESVTSGQGRGYIISS